MRPKCELIKHFHTINYYNAIPLVIFLQQLKLCNFYSSFFNYSSRTKKSKSLSIKAIKYPIIYGVIFVALFVKDTGTFLLAIISILTLFSHLKYLGHVWSEQRRVFLYLFFANQVFYNLV